MADAQTECGEHGSDRQGSDERSRDGSRSDQGGDDRKDEDGKKDNKPGLLERYPIIRYVLIGALILGIVAAAFWYINYRQRGQYLQSTNNAYVRADFVTVSGVTSRFVRQTTISRT